MEIAVSRDDGNRQFTLTKTKEGADGLKHGFSLIAVDLGPLPEIDDEGERVVSCAVEQTEITVGGARVKAKIPVGAVVAHKALREAIGRSGERMPGTSAIPPGVLAVHSKQWQDCYNVLDAVDETTDARAFGKAVEARKKRFLRARAALQERELIGSVNGLYWLAA